MTELLNIFPLCLFKHKVSNSLDINQHFVPLITELVQKNEEFLNPPESWLCPDLTTSYDNRQLNDQIFSKSDLLSNCFQEVFSLLTNNRATNCEVSATWFNYYTKNSYQEWHDHINPNHINCLHRSNLSFVYFLSFNPDYHGSLTFKDPSHSVRAMSADSLVCGYEPEWTPKIEEGDMIVFPLYLEHSVKPFKKVVENPVPRITISGNVRLDF